MWWCKIYVCITSGSQESLEYSRSVFLRTNFVKLFAIPSEIPAKLKSVTINIIYKHNSIFKNIWSNLTELHVDTVDQIELYCKFDVLDEADEEVDLIYRLKAFTKTKMTTFWILEFVSFYLLNSKFFLSQTSFESCHWPSEPHSLSHWLNKANIIFIWHLYFDYFDLNCEYYMYIDHWWTQQIICNIFDDNNISFFLKYTVSFINIINIINFYLNIFKFVYLYPANEKSAKHFVNLE